MKTLICTAQSFGFGPVSKLLAITEKIANVKKVFFGSGVSYDLAKLHSFDEIYPIENNNANEILKLLEKADVFLNVMDFALNKIAKQSELPYFLIDSLLWFWPAKPEGVECANTYFCQNFFTPVALKIKEYGLTNACVIGPIVSDSFERLQKKNQAIINFGGLENPFVQIGSNSNYPFVILKNLLPLLRNYFAHILVTGRGRVMEMCQEIFGKNEFVDFQMLSQKRMLEELYRSQALFTAPGIQSFYDAADKLPIFCLPPQNNSNARNLDALIAAKAVRHFMRWEELYDIKLNWQETKEDGEEVRMVLEKISLFENNESDQSFFKQKAINFLNARNSWAGLVEIQKKAIKSLGKDGVKTILGEINDVLEYNYRSAHYCDVAYGLLKHDASKM